MTADPSGESPRRRRKAKTAAGLMATLAMAAIGLGGCASARLRTPDVQLPTAFERGQGATEAELPAQALDAWWMLFPDPQLHALVEQALQSAPTARTALARLEEAAATRRALVLQLLPQGGLQGSVVQQHSERSGFGNFNIPGFTNSGDTTTYQASFNPTWEIDLFGRSRAARRGVNADFLATRFNVEASRMSLAADVAQSLFQARALAVQLEDARQTVRIRTDAARVGRVRADRGLASEADARRLQSDLETSEAEAARLAAALDGAKRTLLVLLGRGTDPLDSLPIEAVSAAPPRMPVSTPGELLARRPDVREAEARLRAEAENVAIARLALFPTFTLAPGASIQKMTGATNSLTKLWSIGIDAALPVLDRPRLMAELRAEKARGEQAVIAFEQSVQNAYGEAENALATLQADETRLALLERAEAGARYAFDAADRGYRAGLTDLTTRLDAERAWLAARSALTGARAQALQDAVAAFKALGGGWNPPPLQNTVAQNSVDQNASPEQAR